MIRIEKATLSVANAISKIAIDSFMEAVAPLYRFQGVRAFKDYACPKCIIDRMTLGNIFYTASDESGPVGMAELIPAISRLSMLFVEVGWQRRGVGKLLIAKIRNDILTDTGAWPEITVDASPNAIGAYECFNFTYTGNLRECQGIRFYPMSLKLSQLTGPT